MKKIFTLMAAVMIAVVVSAQETTPALAITMESEKSAGEAVTLKLVAGGSQKVHIDWGDGVLEEFTVSNAVNSPTSITKNLPVDNPTIKVYVDGSAITVFDCSNNGLTSLDLTNTSSLNYLHCNENKLTELDISTQPRLYRVTCRKNEITSFDVSQNTELNYLEIWSNKLTSLTGLENTLIKNLYVRFNPLGSINVAGITTLQTLDARNCGLTSLDVTGCTSLTTLNINSVGPANANSFDACALDALYETLPSTGGTMTVVYDGTMEYDGLMDAAGSNATLATAKGWTVKAQTGTTTYTSDGGGCVETSVSALKAAQFTLTPNPAKAYTQLNVGENVVGAMLYVYDLTGKVVMKREVQKSIENLNVSKLHKGVYMVSVGGVSAKLVVL